MPKKFSIVQKREWLRAYESGTPETQIAKSSSCGLRTVRKGIDEARLERDSMTARADLIKESLRRHNESLLNLIEEIALALISPPASQRIPSGDATGVFPITGGNVRYQLWPEPRVLEVILKAEARPEWELLSEHLNRDRLRATLARWKRDLGSYLQAAMNLRRKLEGLVEEKTGYKFSEKPAKGAYLDMGGLDFLLENLLGRMSRQGTASNVTSEIITDIRRGEVTYGRGLALAHAAGNEEKCKKSIIAAINALLGSSQWGDVQRTFARVEKSASEARRAAEEIRLLGLLPGRGRICSRLGI